MNPRLVSPADAGLIAILAAVVGLALAASLSGGPGAQARVSLAGEEQAVLDLHQEKSLIIQGPQGESRVEVSDGRARFTRAPCSDRICMRRGAIDQAGESTSCVPNRVHVEIIGDGKRYDSLHY